MLILVLLLIGSTGSASAPATTTGAAPDPSPQQAALGGSTDATSVRPALVPATRGGPRASTTDRDPGGLGVLAPVSGQQSLGGSIAVRSLQRNLSQLGYSVGSIDGRYGPLTEAGVRRFQKDGSLGIDVVNFTPLAARYAG
jgi:peptidoglycan hydrolase-like protein with peptidoglycan-binding domain